MTSAGGQCRRSVIAGFGALPVSAALGGARAANEIRLRDIVGREVVLPGPARRIVLGAWVTLDALTLLHSDPASLLVGWGGASGVNEFELDRARRRFPMLDQVPVLTRGSLVTASTEAIIAARPDLVVLSRFDALRYGPETTTPELERLRAADIPVLIVDFLVDPAGNTEKSIDILGKALGREAEAQSFLGFYRERRGSMSERLREVAQSAWPSVMFHGFAASQDCCWTMGAANHGGIVRMAGGRNIGDAILSRPVVQVSLEFIYAGKPDIYVATGGRNGRLQGGEMRLGREVAPDRAAADFRALTARPEIAAIDAVAAGRAHAIWHGFVDTPLHIVGVEMLAKWFHPERFADLDPAGTLAEINRRFLSVPLEGTFWVGA